MVEERGPGWYDVSTYAEHLRERWNVLVYFRLAPPIRRVDGRGYTSWCGSVELHSSGTNGRHLRTFAAPWGARGAARTAPGALYAALTEAEGWLEERKNASEAQAAF